MKSTRKATFYTTMILGTVATAATVGSLFYFKVADSSSSLRVLSRPSLKPNVATDDNFNTTNNRISNSDGTLKENETPKPKDPEVIIKTPELPKPKPEPIKEPEKEVVPPVIVQPEPEPKPVDPPKVEPEPVPEPIKPPEDKIVIEDSSLPKPEPKPNKTIEKIEKNGAEFYAEIIRIPPRTDDQSDIDKGITNRVPYRAEIAPDVGKVYNGDSDANVNASINTIIRNAKWQDGIFGKGSTYREILTSTNDSLEVKQNYFNNDGNTPDQLGNLWFKYFRLLKSKEKIRPYLDEDGLRNLDKWYDGEEMFSWPTRSGVQTVKLGHLLLIMHIDQTKITKISDGVKNYLKQGYSVPDGVYSYVNDKGEWEATTFEPLVNKGLAEIRRNNRVKRVLGNNDIWSRSPDDIERGKFHNWDDKDVTRFFREKHGFGQIMPYRGGIYVTEYTRKDKVEGADREKALVVTIDLESDKAFQNAKAVIERFKQREIDITGYRIKNIGKKGATQSLFDIMGALPNKLPMLELYFESKNTADLLAIKNKEIDELSLITNNRVNSLADDWALNPWAINKVAWVNMADYNVSSSYNPNDTIYTRITFDNLAFDPVDYTTPGDFSKINDGLRMAYWVRNNERIFQGPWGPGLTPDRDASGNSYPMGIDLSRIKSIKSLMGMVFHDIKNPSKMRKLNKIKLYNNSSVFDISTTEMNLSQFDTVLIKQSRSPRSKIMFSNGTVTNKIRIIPTKDDERLSSAGLANLSTFIQYSDGNFSKSNTEIIIPKGALDLESQLRSAGYKVKFQSKYDGIVIN
ncbi:Uncharacterised protein [Mycoplasmopsis maculosa]|uniref:Immunoglobulin-blocking virulence protein n=1 Tax=Mycoplasmopsis maculosa TaxID=114885 RepID=A0A449B3S8_9BACT|nr:putative immunoglobulin-blocking virulence protein [Mycoplasmopsis maculosa]VEU75236.1 Uncharacterised protein [Mycoplasmopsis maculosa]